MATLYVDKHRPTSLDKLTFNTTQAARLKKLVTDGDFPHMLFYGPSGAGKKTRIMCMLREVYGPGVEKLRIEHKTFTTPSNKKVEVTTIASNFHVEVNPSDAGMQDRLVVQEMIKEMAGTQQLDANGQRSFKVIVISEVDRLSKAAQAALRRTMEKYMSTCRLVLCCSSTSQVIPPIRSRCFGVRVQAPQEAEIIQALHGICAKENMKDQLPDELARRIATASNRNARRAILMLEACKVRQYPFKPNQEVVATDWERFLAKTAQKILTEQSPQRLHAVRKDLYELLAHCIPADMIIRMLATELMSVLDDPLKVETCELAAYYEHRMRKGSKEIFHLEAFVAKFMALFRRFTLNMMDE